MLERRSRGERRWGLEVLFPLVDSKGITVIIERRRVSDRRLDNIALAERMMLFSEMLPLDPALKKNH
jgi:hypothetical protein